MYRNKKILLVQLFSNGDCLYATTIARQIKGDYPGCYLTWAIAGFCKTIIANNPFVDEVMEVNSVVKNDESAFRRFMNELSRRKSAKEFDELFITQIFGKNQAFYDGSIRSTIFRAYPNIVTVPVQPVLRLFDSEKKKVEDFSLVHNLSSYKYVLLFEFAPLSGQANITRAMTIEIAEKLTVDKSVCVILSSGNKLEHPNENVIDGSVLTLRETAALTHYCTMLIGCSSGITWASTSDAAKVLPMIQIMNPKTNWLNPVSRDFMRFGFNTDSLIELTTINEKEITNCIEDAIKDFKSARGKYNHEIQMNFRTTRNIVYNLLCYFQFAAIWTHIRINKQVYGNRLSFYYEVFMGLITAPFKLIRNVFRKKIFKK
jgi:ADP-heptose:LPS heptosyltransferase